MEPATIHFADDSRPKRQFNEQDVGGVVPLRVRSHSRGGKSSFELFKEGAIESAEDEDAGLRNENDYKRRQVCQTQRLNHSVR
jgi:KUP system potassium uptake protein